MKQSAPSLKFIAGLHLYLFQVWGKRIFRLSPFLFPNPRRKRGKIQSNFLTRKPGTVRKKVKTWAGFFACPFY
jgi:hypothetical protein